MRIQVVVSWVVMLCSVVVGYQRLIRYCYHNIQCECGSTRPSYHNTTQCQNPGDHNLLLVTIQGFGGGISINDVNTA